MACAAPTDEDLGADEAPVLDRGVDRGRASIHFLAPSAGAPDEVCVLPKHLTGADYSSGDGRFMVDDAYVR